jgi:hypothetical protein
MDPRRLTAIRFPQYEEFQLYMTAAKNHPCIRGDENYKQKHSCSFYINIFLSGSSTRASLLSSARTRVPSLSLGCKPG